MQKKIYCFCQTLPRKYAAMISMAALLLICASPAYAVEDMWTVGREIITDVYSQIAGISTVLAGLMSAVAVLGCKSVSYTHLDVYKRQRQHRQLTPRR